jgi:hypothetical protein
VRARNLELEEAILRDFSPESFLVYGDWLTAQGDWRGELVEVQARLATSARGSKVLLRREKELLARYEEEWGWRIPWRWRVTFEWRYGFIERIKGDDLPNAAQVIESILAFPEARFAREIYLAGDEDADFRDVPAALAAAGAPIRSIRAELDWSGQEQIAGELGDLSPLWTLKTLEHLGLRGDARELVLGEIDAPNLNTFSLDTPAGIGPDVAAAIGRARWPRLSYLVIHRVRPDDLRHLRPILDGEGVPALRNLRLADANLDEGILAEVATWRALAQLETLTVEINRLTMAGANTILANAEVFRKLAAFKPHRDGGVDLDAYRILRVKGLVR